MPLTTPAFASNASLPSIAVTTNNPALGGKSEVFSVTITNPSSNSFTVTGVSINMATGWTATAAGKGGYLIVASVSGAGSGVLYGVSSFTVGTTAGIPPGQSDTVTFTATSATGAYPFNSMFTTSVQDASAVNFYTGPSFTVQVIDPSTSIAIAYTPNSATYIAGTAPYTVTATITAPEAEPGLTVIWSDFGTGAVSATFPSSFSAPSSTSSAATATTATATVTYQPSETAGKTGILSATIGSSGITSPNAPTITTKAGAPSAVTVTAEGSSTSTGYITTSGTPTWTSPTPVLSAEIASGGITGSLTDAFGNSVTSGISAQTCTIITFGGLFQSGTTSTTTDNTASCSTAGAIASDENYFQGLTFGTTTYVQVSMTGTYNGGSFTAIGRSQTLSTSSMDTSAGTPACSGTALSAPGNCAAANTVSAGSSTGVISTITLTYTLTTNQLNVPIEFIAVNSTSPALGYFVAGQTSGHPVGNPAHKVYANITVNSVENSAGTAAIATATFTVDPYVGHSPVTFEVQFAHPITGTPSNVVGPGTATGAVTTIAGAPSTVAGKGLLVSAFFTSPASNPTTKTVPGQNVYLDVSLVDYWSNAVTCTAALCGGQLQIALTSSLNCPTCFSATSVYIAQGKSDTLNSFGTITFAVPSMAPLGSVTLTASGFYSGSGTLTIVSPNPTISVNTPSGTVGHLVYSKFSGVGFSGSAAPSAGYLAGSVTIKSVTYSVDGGAAVTASGTTAWTAVPTMSSGLHTLKFTVTDSNGNTATNSTTVLVDTSAPTITNPTTLSYGAGTPIVFTVVDSEGDLASVSATVNGTALPASQVSITSGTNNPGSSVTYTVSVTGLAATTGHYGIVLSATDMAGNKATGTAVVVQVTVAFAQSLVLSGSLSSSIVNGYTGVTATYSNQWSSSQSVIVFAVWKNSIGQTVYVSAGSATLAAGGSQSFFLPEVGLAAGTYTVNVSVWTTANQPVSIQTTATITV